MSELYYFATPVPVQLYSLRVVRAMEHPQNEVVPRGRSNKAQKRVHVLLVDGSSIILHGLQSFLSGSDHIKVVGTARTERAALTALKICQPDVVVLAARVGRASGIDICRLIRESYPNIAVLFFSECDDKAVLQSAIRAGAHGYLLNISSREVVVRSIELVATGQSVLDRHVTQQVLNWVRQGGWGAPQTIVQGHSEEDKQILSFVADGRTNKEIARELELAQTVIEACLQRLYRRLRITRRTEAASHFVRFASQMFPYQ